MNLDLPLMKEFLDKGQYQLFVSYLAEANHPAFDELKQHIDNYETDTLPTELIIEDIRLPRDDIIRLLNTMRQVRQSGLTGKFAVASIGFIALVIGISGIYLFLNNQMMFGVLLMCALPSSIFLFYLADLETY